VFSRGRYAEMLATGGVMANEVFVTCIQPLRAGEEAYAMAFAVPINAKGLKILSRKSYEEGATKRLRQSVGQPLR
jgi:4-hydroxyphenylacetate 3-monooxygenase